MGIATWWPLMKSDLGNVPSISSVYKSTMTEDQIERQVGRTVDHIDFFFMQGWMSQEEYDIAMKKVDLWAETQYRKAKPKSRSQRLNLICSELSVHESTK
jgi:hypothetical protein